MDVTFKNGMLGMGIIFYNSYHKAVTLHDLQKSTAYKVHIKTTIRTKDK